MCRMLVIRHSLKKYLTVSSSLFKTMAGYSSLLMLSVRSAGKVYRSDDFSPAVTTKKCSDGRSLKAVELLLLPSSIGARLPCCVGLTEVRRLPWSLVRPGFEPTTFHTQVQRSTDWLRVYSFFTNLNLDSSIDNWIRLLTSWSIKSESGSVFTRESLGRGYLETLGQRFM